MTSKNVRSTVLSVIEAEKISGASAPNRLVTPIYIDADLIGASRPGAYKQLHPLPHPFSPTCTFHPFHLPSLIESMVSMRIRDRW